MTLAAGTRLGPYEILAAIGAGGMGEVYRARDTRLDRIVAIKVLPPHLASDPQFRDRFDREARAISQLNHPHICTLYDVGEEAGTAYLVMELLEGETLAVRLEKGMLPLDQGLEVAIQIADALAAAHKAGIVHRDLKPGNIMLTKTGAKLMDFGLAKTGTSVLGGTNVSMLPTTPPITQQGSILGTFQYMAPEQLEGHEADMRSDIFTFGAVLYEMVTGKKAFEGKSQASLIGAIMHAEPPPLSSCLAKGGSTVSSVPAREGVDQNTSTEAPIVRTLDRIVHRCLAKSPDDRWQSTSDLAEALRWLAEGRWPSRPGAGASIRTPMVERVMWALALVVALGVGWDRARPRPESHRSVERFALSLPPGAQFNGGVAISPDGSNIVYGVSGNGGAMLYRRMLDDVQPVRIRGTEEGETPFFSPDGRWIGFFDNSALKKVPVQGGPATTLCAAGYRRGAAWGRNGVIYFAADPSPDVMQVSETGGEPQPAVRATDFGGVKLRWPHLLPDASVLLFTLWSGSVETARLGAHAFQNGKSQTLFAGTNPLYAETGHLLFARDGSLWAGRFDRDRLIVTGSPAPVLEHLRVNPGGLALAAVASDGSLVSVSDDSGRPKTAHWITRSGHVEPLDDEPRLYDGSPTMSPNGEKLAFAVGDSSRSDIWLYDLVRHVPTRLALKGRNQHPVWTADGQAIIYLGPSPDGEASLLLVRTDGAGSPERLNRRGSVGLEAPTSASSDGELLALTEPGIRTGSDIWIQPLHGDRSARPFLATPSNERVAVFSPDGRWIAYTSDETARTEVYVRAFPGPGGQWLVSRSNNTTSETLIGWRADGKELYYGEPTGGATLMAVSVETNGEVFKAQPPHALFTAPRNVTVYPVATRDGSRFVAFLESDATTPTRGLDLTLNWVEELKARVPVK